MLSRIGRCGIGLIAVALATGPTRPAWPQSPAAAVAGKAPAGPRRQAAKSDNPFLSAGTPVTTWFSLGPERQDLAGASYDKDEVTSGLRANESITVFGRRHLDVPEDNRPTTLGEAWNSPAAQSVVPALGSGCTKYTVCVDPSQKGLFSSIFGN
jgi:hypothetical protein